MPFRLPCVNNWTRHDVVAPQLLSIVQADCQAYTLDDQTDPQLLADAPCYEVTTPCATLHHIQFKALATGHRQKRKFQYTSASLASRRSSLLMSKEKLMASLRLLLAYVNVKRGSALTVTWNVQLHWGQTHHVTDFH